MYQSGEMLCKLYEAMDLLPQLISKREVWDSLIVNRRKPYTYRVFTTLPNGLRLCLHKFDPCHTHEAFSHPHPWPGAFTILQGAYNMKVGYSVDRQQKPDSVVDLELSKFSCYEIINPLTWHSVIPLETTYTVMINDTPWDADYAHQDVRTTKGKDLDKMPEQDLLSHLMKFKVHSLEWLLEKAQNVRGRALDAQLADLNRHNDAQLEKEKSQIND